MANRWRFFVLMMVLILTAAACGGDSESSTTASESTNQAGQDDGSNDSDGGTTDGDDGADDPGSDDGSSGTNGDGGPDLDPSAMPPVGEVVIAIDGQTFTIEAATMDYFTCDPSPEFTNVQSESATQDLGIQADAQSERGGANVTVEGSDVVYNSFFGPETSGGVAVDGQHIVYEGRFDATNPDDPASFTDVGTGRISVTCP